MAMERGSRLDVKLKKNQENLNVRLWSGLLTTDFIFQFALLSYIVALTFKSVSFFEWEGGQYI